MTKVRYHRLAEQEAAEAIDWYEDQQPGLGEDFLDELNRASVAIASNPLTWPIWPGVVQELGIRRFLLPRFPYGLAFVIADLPVIIAVAHLRRRPLYWLDRLE